MGSLYDDMMEDHARKMRGEGKQHKMINKPRKFIVYIEQVNQTCVDVDATNEEEAIEEAGKKWKRLYGYPSIMSVETVE
jgi:hypothetical protein